MQQEAMCTQYTNKNEVAIKSRESDNTNILLQERLLDSCLRTIKRQDKADDKQ